MGKQIAISVLLIHLCFGCSLRYDNNVYDKDSEESKFLTDICFNENYIIRGYFRRNAPIPYGYLKVFNLDNKEICTISKSVGIDSLTNDTLYLYRYTNNPTTSNKLIEDICVTAVYSEARFYGSVRGGTEHLEFLKRDMNRLYFRNIDSNKTVTINAHELSFLGNEISRSSFSILPEGVVNIRTEIRLLDAENNTKFFESLSIRYPTKLRNEDMF